MAIADNRQRFMPLPEDRLRHRGKPLDFPEAVMLVNPKEPEFKGEVLLLLHDLALFLLIIFCSFIMKSVTLSFYVSI